MFGTLHSQISSWDNNNVGDSVNEKPSKGDKTGQIVDPKCKSQIVNLVSSLSYPSWFTSNPKIKHFLEIILQTTEEYSHFEPWIAFLTALTGFTWIVMHWTLRKISFLKISLGNKSWNQQFFKCLNQQFSLNAFSVIYTFCKSVSSSYS